MRRIVENELKNFLAELGCVVYHNLYFGGPQWLGGEVCNGAILDAVRDIVTRGIAARDNVTRGL